MTDLAPDTTTMEDASEAAPARAWLAPLVGVRGLAAVWVVLYHFRMLLTSAFPDSDVFLEVVRRGYLGVDLFAILSGFVIAMNYGDRLRTPDRKATTEFIWLRLARIYPLVLFVLAIFVATESARGMPSSRIWGDEQLWLQALMLNGWGVGSDWGWNSPSWTVSSEWLCYLLFPVFALGLGRVRTGITAAVLAAVTLFVTVLVMRRVGHPEFDAFLEWGVLRIAGEFMTGCWLYRVYDARLGAGLPWGGVGLLVAIAGIALSPVSAAVSVVLFAVLVLALAHDAQPMSMLFGNRVAVFLGEISYSMYLIHWYVVWDGNRFFNSQLQVFTRDQRTAFLLACVLVLSTMTYYGIERPARKWMRARIGR